MRRFILNSGFLFLFVPALILFTPPVIKAADSPLPGALKIVQNSATGNFPDSLNFVLNLASTGSFPDFQRAELNYRLVGDVATRVRPANLEKDPARGISARYELNTHQRYIPPGARISYYWTLFDQASNSYSTGPEEVVFNDARFPFKEISSGIVKVRWYQGDAPFGKKALDKAVATIEKLGRLYGIEPRNPINITLYPDNRTLFTALPPNTAEWVGGQAIPTYGTVVLGIPPGDLKEIGRSIPHEVSHQVVYQATFNPYNSAPRWLDEGLAVLNQDQVDPFLLEAFERAVDKQALPSLRALNGSFPADTQESYVAYAQSVKVLQYTTEKYGQAAIGRMLAAFKKGITFDEAVQAGTGLNIDQLDREWRKSIGYPVPDAPLETTAPAALPSPTLAVPTPGPPTPVPTLTPVIPTLTPLVPTSAPTLVISSSPPSISSGVEGLLPAATPSGPSPDFRVPARAPAEPPAGPWQGLFWQVVLVVLVAAVGSFFLLRRGRGR